MKTFSEFLGLLSKTWVSCFSAQTKEDDTSVFHDIKPASFMQSPRLQTTQDQMVNPSSLASHLTNCSQPEIHSLTPFIDVDEMGWSQTQKSSKLFAASEPNSDPASLAEFYHFLTRENIGLILDLRPGLISDADPDPDFLDVVYYPKELDKSLTFNDIIVSTKRVSSGFSDAAVSASVLTEKAKTLNIVIQDKSTKAELHQLRVLHYLNWNDFGVAPIAEFKALGQVLIQAKEKNINSLVHCVGGVGRTGTLITYAQLENARRVNQEQFDPIAIPKKVNEQIQTNLVARSKGCVETQNQKDSICKALLDG